MMWHQHCMLLCTRWHEHPDWPVTIATLARIRMRRPRIGVIENVPGMELVRAGSDESALSLVKKLLMDMQYSAAHCSVDLSIFHRASRARTLLCCANVVRVCVCVCVCACWVVPVCLQVFLSVCLSVSPSVSPEFCPSARLSVCLCVSLPVSVSRSLSVCMFFPVHSSVRPSAALACTIMWDCLCLSLPMCICSCVC